MDSEHLTLGTTLDESQVHRKPGLVNNNGWKQLQKWSIDYDTEQSQGRVRNEAEGKQIQK